MAFISSLTEQKRTVLLNVIQESLTISRHQHFYHWLQGDFQHLIPHEILVTAWGDFSLGLVHVNIVSGLPGVRTTEVETQRLVPLLVGFFNRWIEWKREPFSVHLKGDGFQMDESISSCAFSSALDQMNSALVQGIKDERGRHDCLYVALSRENTFDRIAAQSMGFLLPYIDAALRQISHLPEQYPDTQLKEHSDPIDSSTTISSVDSQPLFESHWGFTTREEEIMNWVCLGKTNSEIGQILDISFFTVKNHMQRIFRKMDVLNRAQAVDKFRSVKQPEL